MPRSRPIAPVLALALLLPAACAQSPAGPQAGSAVATDPRDPLEPLNRDILEFNLAADDCCIRPVAMAYRDALHPWVRERIRNVIATIEEPRIAANALLQGEPRVATETALRFVINATLGLGGMFDLAEIGGPPRRERDFGQTLHVWGVGEGPYLMLPIAGPSNPRDLAGLVADGFMNPISYFVPFWGNMLRGVVDGVDIREQNIEEVDNLRAESLDFYARLRSVWQQQRDSELGRPAPEEPGGLDVLDDPEADAPGAAPAAAAPVPPRARPAAAPPRRGGVARGQRALQ